MIELIAAIILGIALGIITGLLPGLHINLVAALMLSFSFFLSAYFSPFGIAVIIAAMSISHVFFDFIPSIFLGAPEEGTALSILPGHALLMRGQGLCAFRLAALGCMLGLIAVILLSPLLVIAVPLAFNTLQPFIGYFLILISLIVLMSEKSGKLVALSIFMLSGILGLLVFQLDISEPLLPMLSGLFGVSTLLKSLVDNAGIPGQIEHGEIPVSHESAKAVGAGIFSGSLLSIFPAVGPAQAAIVAGSALKRISSESYLVMIGCIAAVSSVFGLVTLYTISKARNGSIVVLSQLFSLDTASFYCLLFVMLIAGGISAILSLNLASYLSGVMSRLDYKALSACTVALISVLVFFFSGIQGIIVLFTSTATGMLSISSGAGRHNAMGCLMIPVILYYF